MNGFTVQTQTQIIPASSSTQLLPEKKRPLWQWILFFLLVGGSLLAGIYYLYTKSSYYSVSNIPGYATPTPTPVESFTPRVTKEFRESLTSEGFDPNPLEIGIGDTVIWENNSGVTATVNSEPHPDHQESPALNLGEFGQGGTLSLKFIIEGSYRYHNHFNPVQMGTVIVKPGI